MAKVSIIGSGFAGISAATYIAAQGHEVHVFEKNNAGGGRSRQLKTDNGYVFDMGPSWYWMPGVFEKFFNDFGYSASDFYKLELLNPSFEILFGNNESMPVPADFDALCSLFESIEPGSAKQLILFMKEAEVKYKLGVENLVYKPALSITEFLKADVIKGALQSDVFSSFSKHVRKYFSNPKLIALMEFPVLFLGAMPQQTPALYSLMNYAGLRLGTWYPQGGFGKVIAAMTEVAHRHGVKFHYNACVEKIEVTGHEVTALNVNGNLVATDALIAATDYHHAEEKLLPAAYRNYNEGYWNKKNFAPSCLIYYIGISKRIKRLEHHTLFFEEDFSQHAIDIYKTPQWPQKPLFYVCCPSKTDNTVAPAGHENLFLLMPVAPGLEDNEALREKYFSIMLKRIEKHAGEMLEPFIDYKKSYCVNDFISDYNAYKGNAYGLANTLNQTAVLKPKIINRKLKNMFYAGQITVPGPGVPPSIISGKIAAGLLTQHLNTLTHETVV